MPSYRMTHQSTECEVKTNKNVLHICHFPLLVPVNSQSTIVEDYVQLCSPLLSWKPHRPTTPSSVRMERSPTVSSCLVFAVCRPFRRRLFCLVASYVSLFFPLWFCYGSWFIRRIAIYVSKYKYMNECAVMNVRWMIYYQGKVGG